MVYGLIYIIGVAMPICGYSCPQTLGRVSIGHPCLSIRTCNRYNVKTLLLIERLQNRLK